MNTLETLLSSRVKAELFRLLFGLDAQELHVRELARRAKLNDATVRQELKRLIALGVVACRQDGNRTYCRADTRHPIYPDLRNLVLKTSGLVEVLAHALKSSKIQVAFVFGSLAANAAKAHSDVDLMVIGDIGLREVGALLGNMTDKIGREVNPHVVESRDFTQRVAAKDHFITSVLKEPKLFLIGDERELERLAQ